MRVHQTDAFNAADIVSILLIEQMEVFFSKTNPERLSVAGSNINIGEYGQWTGP